MKHQTIMFVDKRKEISQKGHDMQGEVAQAALDCVAITRYHVRQFALLSTKISSPSENSD
ncbi:hypothetical protein P4S73_07575 [Paraglaciecola sp. Hal342]|jgi:hypothetical protein